MENKTLQSILEEERSKATNIRFGRDYYIREAAKSTGARKKLASDDDDDSGYQQIKTQFESTEDSPKEVTSPASNPDTFIYKAVPAVVDTGSESPIEIASPIRKTPNILEISSDSDLSIERVYNLNSGKVYEKVGDTQREIIAGSKNPEGRSSIEFDKNVVVVDENHNTTTTTNVRKRDFLRSLTQTSNGDTSISSPTSDDVFNDQSSTQTIPQVPSSKPPPIVNEMFIQEEVIVSNNESSLNNKEFSLEYSTDEYESILSSKDTSLNVSEDPEIHDLKDKHLVKDRLGIFSKSYPNLAAVPLRKTGKQKEFIPEPEDRRYSNEISPTLVKMLDKSVEDLKKKFDQSELQTKKDELTKKEVHSLTARSLSREFRQELKGKENGIETEPQTQSTEQDDNELKEPKVFPNAKSRIQFFENLKR